MKNNTLNSPVIPEISLFKMPIVDLQMNISAEVLSRIGDLKLSPEKFLWSITQTQKIMFDYIVFDKVISLLSKWLIDEPEIHINLHPETLLDLNFKTLISHIFDKHDFKQYEKVSFEILENGQIGNNELLNFNIWYLRYIWCKVWLDDYPNQNNNNELLSIIKELDFVKIDKAYLLSHTLDNEQNVISALSSMVEQIRAIHPNVKIIVEWVENEYLAQLVPKINGICAMQWYYFGKPKEIDTKKI